MKCGTEVRSSILGVPAIQTSGFPWGVGEKNEEKGKVRVRVQIIRALVVSLVKQWASSDVRSSNICRIYLEDRDNDNVDLKVGRNSGNLI